MGFNSFEFADEVCTSLYGNLDTLSVGNSTLQLWTSATGNLNKAWQEGDPNSWPATAIGALKTNDEIQKFLDEYLTPAFIYSFSTANITQLLDQLSDHWDKDAGPVQMSEIQTFGNLISATQQVETSTGDTASKAEASFLQQSTSAQQPVADLGNAAIGILGTIGSLLMQSFV